jgi:carbon storage regulator
MLVLSRKSGEDVVIGQDVVVRVLSVRGGTVRLGITAPRDVGIIRGELVARIASNTAPIRNWRLRRLRDEQANILPMLMLRKVG